MSERANDYVKEWLGAYLDGELSADRRSWVEEHLADCLACQQELLELRALSALLHADPAPAPFLEPEAFSRQVLNRLPPPLQPAWQRALRLGLRFTPLGLFCAWAFFQAVIWVTSALLYALPLFPQAEGWLATLTPGWYGAGADLLGYGYLGQLIQLSGLNGLTEGTDLSFLFGPLTLINLVFLAVLAAVFFAWLAGLWTYRRSQSNEVA